jgi:23S rRNA pseudouridine1911/1915/1917 synthase
MSRLYSTDNRHLVTNFQTFFAEVPATAAGLRLDQALAGLFPEFSRGKLQEWIKAGNALVDGVALPVKHKVYGGERIELQAEVALETAFIAQDIPLDVVFEDNSVLIVNKPSGLVVHPAAGHPDGTLQNALLHHCPALAGIPRAGLVHRIDKDTSGLLMVAKTLRAHKSLVDQLQERSIHREYLALVQGYITAGDTLDEPIGRHPTDRKRYSVRPEGKPAVTHYRVQERFSVHTLLRVKLETGRTHQIRVHMSYIHHPLVGDPVYGGRMRLPAGGDQAVAAALHGFRRQALHAEHLGLEHPETGDWMEWQVDMPDDMADLLNVLRAHS